jgi:hypothetical protein
MAQHAIQRPMRARLAIGTGLLVAGMLLVAPAATAFATPPDGSSGCTSVAANVGHCHTNDGGTATTTTGGTKTVSHRPCAKPAESTPSETATS